VILYFLEDGMNCCLILASFLLLICGVAAALAIEWLDCTEWSWYACMESKLNLHKASGHCCGSANRAVLLQLLHDLQKQSS